MISRWTVVTLVATGCANEPDGWSGEAAPADVGAPIGDEVTETIGADGGDLVSADGVFRLAVPAGALAADTELTVQAITNTAWGGLGDGYRVSPAVVFDVPVEVTFGFTDADLLGTTVDALGIAAQDADGYWVGFGDGTVDGSTIGVETTDLGSPVPLARTAGSVDFAKHWRIRLEPAESTVARGGTRELELVACAEVLGWPFPDGAGLALGAPAPYVDPGPVAWTVEGSPAGTVTGDDGGAEYVAPDACGAENVVKATLASGLAPEAKLLVVDDCPTTTTGAPGTWVGTTEVSSSGFLYTSEVTWTLLDADGDVEVFVPAGHVDVTIFDTSGCDWDPLSSAIAETDGQLTIDRSTEPATYSGQGVTVWDLTITCPGVGAVQSVMPTSWFGDFEDVVTTSGPIENVGGVEVIEGSSSAEDATISWRFEKR